MDGDSDIQVGVLTPRDSVTLVRDINIDASLAGLSRAGRHRVVVGALRDFYQVTRPVLSVTVARERRVNLDTTSARDDQGNRLTLLTGDQAEVRFGSGSVTFSVPVAASQGVVVSSFVDTTSGISIIGRRVEVPVKDDTGNLLLRLVGRLQDVLRGPPDGGAATGTFESLEVQTEERQQDLSADDPDVGTLAVAVTGDLINLPPDATMEVVVKKRLSPEDRTRVEEATRSEATAMVVADEAGVVTVNTTGLVNDDITEVTLKMTVSLRWASNFGVNNIRMAHVDADGNVEILVPECEVNFLTIEAVCIARTARGFSEISLLSLKPESTDFALSGFTITPDAVEPGKTVKVSVDVVNQGIAEASFSSILKLKRDEPGEEFESVDTESITLGPRDTGTITYFVRQSGQGRYRVGIEGARGDFVQGTFDVFEELRPEDLTFSDLRVVRKDTSERVPDGGTVRPTQELAISMNIANTSSDPGRTVIALRLNGALIQIKSVFVSAAGSAEISFDFTPPVEGTYKLELLELTETVLPLGITINAAVLPADLVFVEPLRVTPAEVFGGAQITVAGQVANVGEEEGTTSVEVLLNGQVAGSLDVTVAGGDTAPFTFTLTAPEALGGHAVRVRSDDVILDLEGSFRVVAGPVEEEGMVLITDVVLEPRVVFIDAQITATVILENSSENVATNPRTIVVTLAGTVVGSATVTLPAGAEGVTREFTFIAPDTAGDSRWRWTA